MPYESLKMIKLDTFVYDKLSLELPDSLLHVSEEGQAQLVVINRLGITQRVDSGTQLGLLQLMPLQWTARQSQQPSQAVVSQWRSPYLTQSQAVVSPVEKSLLDPELCGVSRVNVSDNGRKCKLLETAWSCGLPSPLHNSLPKHSASSLESEERLVLIWCRCT